MMAKEGSVLSGRQSFYEPFRLLVEIPRSKISVRDTLAIKKKEKKLVPLFFHGACYIYILFIDIAINYSIYKGSILERVQSGNHPRRRIESTQCVLVVVPFLVAASAVCTALKAVRISLAVLLRNSSVMILVAASNKGLMSR